MVMGYKKRSAIAKLRQDIWNDALTCLISSVYHQIHNLFRQFTGLGALGGVVCGGILLYKGDESAFKALMSAVSRLFWELLW